MSKFLVKIWLFFFFITNSFSCTISKILVDKGDKKLYLLSSNNDICKEYNINRIGKNQGKKQCSGDKKTPEGIYYIKSKRKSQKYIRFIEISYPNNNDLQQAKELSCYAGDSIGIHYYNSSINLDGSLGCITFNDKKDILELYDLIDQGMEIEIQ